MLCRQLFYVNVLTSDTSLCERREATRPTWRLSWLDVQHHASVLDIRFGSKATFSRYHWLSHQQVFTRKSACQILILLTVFTSNIVVSFMNSVTCSWEHPSSPYLVQVIESRNWCSLGVELFIVLHLYPAVLPTSSLPRDLSRPSENTLDADGRVTTRDKLFTGQDRLFVLNFHLTRNEQRFSNGEERQHKWE